MKSKDISEGIEYMGVFSFDIMFLAIFLVASFWGYLLKMFVLNYQADKHVSCKTMCPVCQTMPQVKSIT